MGTKVSGGGGKTVVTIVNGEPVGWSVNGSPYTIGSLVFKSFNWVRSKPFPKPRKQVPSALWFVDSVPGVLPLNPMSTKDESMDLRSGHPSGPSWSRLRRLLDSSRVYGTCGPRSSP